MNLNFAFGFDIAAGCLLAFFAVRGAFRGFSGEVIALIGLAASVFCGWTFAQPAAEIVLGYFPDWDATVVALACSVLLFIGVSLLFAFLGRIASLLIRAANLSMTDHFLGVFAGGLRAFFVLLFIYGAVSIFSPVLPSDWMKESYAMRGAAVVWPPVVAFLSERGWIDLNRLAPTEPAADRRQREGALSGDVPQVLAGPAGEGN